MNPIVTSHAHNLAIMKNTAPSLAYRGDTPFADWQTEARKKLCDLLGLARFTRCEPLFDIESETVTEGRTEIRFTFQSEEGYFVPCVLCIPEGATEPKPLVVCLQGHSKGMHVSFNRTRYEGEELLDPDGDRDFVPQIIANGYCALALEQRNFGECGGTPEGPRCYESAMAALLLGRTTIAERVWDVMRALDVVLEHFPQVNGQKLAVMGNSGGGTTSFYTACLEDRLSLAMPSCAMCTYDASIASLHHCACNFVPQIRNYFNMGDLAGLIAPKKLIVVAGRHDNIFPLEGVKETYAQIEQLYAAAGVPQNCRLVVGEKGHQFYAAKAWPIVHALFD